MRKSRTKTIKAGNAAAKRQRRHAPVTHSQKLIFKPQVLELLGGIAYSTLWEWMKAGWFPLPLEIGPPNGRSSTIAWNNDEVTGWIANRPRRPIGQNVHAFRGKGADKPNTEVKPVIEAKERYVARRRAQKQAAR